MSTNISFSKINTLAIPALIAGIAEPILSLTDAAIIGHMPNKATVSLAAVGIVSSFLSMLIWVFGQSRSAISSILSQYLGAKKIETVKYLPAQAITIIVLISIIIVIITSIFAETIFKFYNASAEILSYCISYFRIRILGFPFTLLTFCVFGIFRGLQNTFYPMIIAISGCVINIILDYLLVYGIANIIAPFGLSGAAYASLIAQILMAIMALVILYKKTKIPLKFTLPLHSELKRFTLMIFNLFIRTLSLNAALYLGTSYATKYGENYIAAYTIGINLWFFGAFLIDGYASAGNILSGKLLGEKSFKTLLMLSKKLIKYGVFSGLCLTAIGYIGYANFGKIFTKDVDVLSEFNKIFWIIITMQPLCALAFIYDGVFKGLGKMKYLRNVLIISTFCVFLPTIIITDYLDLKLHGIFFAFTLWITARGIPLIIKFNKTYKPLAQNN